MRSLTVFVMFLCLSCSAQADITWNVNFVDGNSNVGFGLGNANGATRRATFLSALNYVSSVLDTPNDVTLDFRVNASQTDGSGFLASAGTSFFNTGGYTNGILFEHAQTGSDPFATGDDGFATFDFGFNWNSENDLAVGGEFDLFTVSVHEVTHALGFLSLANAAGNSQFGNANPGTFSVLNSFLERGDGRELWASGSTGEFLGTAADLTSNDVFFDGVNARAANGGAPIKMFAPGGFSGGSSISHVDTATFPTAVMTASIASGVNKKEYSDIDLAILQDIGWTVKTAVVPEPGSAFVLSLSGGLLLLRRQRRSA